MRDENGISYSTPGKAVTLEGIITYPYLIVDKQLSERQLANEFQGVVAK